MQQRTLIFKSLSSFLTKHTVKEQKRVLLLHTHQNGELGHGLGKSLGAWPGQGTDKNQPTDASVSGTTNRCFSVSLSLSSEHTQQRCMYASIQRHAQEYPQ
ncbi:hypothetical protein QTO34_002513 [Cnephaeus nilssonii]|uniref:Uncharacterized protein n=1 Tax=Cnephaeus nilssonii TaxID=3371016 RepID=A0AA40HSI0_CNENI|nr:hypothetical protein QTO34_002513 [Eptesicus nilssonii]